MMGLHSSALLLMAALSAALWLGSDGRWFDPHHEYHYSYSARTQTWLDHEINTIIKVKRERERERERERGKFKHVSFKKGIWQVQIL